MSMLLKVRGIGTSRDKLKEFAFIAFYILGLDQESLKIYAYINYKLQLVESLKINMLVRNNILYTKN